MEDERWECFVRMVLGGFRGFDVGNSTGSSQREGALFLFDEMGFEGGRLLLFVLLQSSFLFFVLLVLFAFILEFNGSIATLIISDELYAVGVLGLELGVERVGDAIE